MSGLNYYFNMNEKFRLKNKFSIERINFNKMQWSTRKS